MMRIHSIYFVLTFLLLIFVAVRSEDDKRKRIIIDTDAGADDAVAILMLLSAEANMMQNKLQTVAITCTYGNTYLKNVEENVLKILTIANRSDIPVYSGAEKSLLMNFTSGNFFGKDGLGDFDFGEEIIATIDRSKHAAVALIELVKEYPGEITLVSIGPSTNVATAIALEPSFIKYLHGHIILGSSVSGIGNLRPNVEFNFGQDPESNSMLLNAERVKPSVIFPWETAISNETTMEWRKNVLGQRNSRIINFLNKAESVYLAKSTAWDVSDAKAVSIIISPKIIKKAIVTRVDPVTDGAARGSVLVDYKNSTGKVQNARIIQEIDLDAFQDLLLELFS